MDTSTAFTEYAVDVWSVWLLLNVIQLCFGEKCLIADLEDRGRSWLQPTVVFVFYPVCVGKRFNVILQDMIFLQNKNCLLDKFCGVKTAFLCYPWDIHSLNTSLNSMLLLLHSNGLLPSESSQYTRSMFESSLKKGGCKQLGTPFIRQWQVYR